MANFRIEISPIIFNFQDAEQQKKYEQMFETFNEEHELADLSEEAKEDLLVLLNKGIRENKVGIKITKINDCEHSS